MTSEEHAELLIRVDERTDRLAAWTSTHEAFHRRMGFALISAAVSIILAQAGMIFALLKIAG
jgi:hypothetical protein